MRHYYAAWHPYGVTTVNTDGLRANVVYRFDSRKLRDMWIAAEPSERLRASSKVWYVRRENADTEHGWMADTATYLDRPGTALTLKKGA